MINLETITNKHLPDYVFQGKDEYYYFNDELDQAHGPYKSEKEAYAALELYCETFFDKDTEV